jgi:hypothetical protein
VITRFPHRILGAVAAAVLICACPAAANAAAAVQGIGVSPLRVDVDVKAGGTARIALTVSNTTETAQAFSFGVVDIQGDKDDPASTPIILGGKVDSAISGYDWINAPDAVTIPAGDKKTVYVGVKVPSDAKGGHYAAVTVTSRAFDIGAGTAASRVAVPFLMNAGGVPPPEIKITEVKDFADGGTKVVYINNGSTAVNPHGSVNRGTVGRGKNKTGDLHCSTALPGGSGICTTDASGSNGSGSGSGHGSGSKGTGGLDGTGPTNGFVELVTDEGTKARGDIPTEWAGTWTSMLLPVAGIVLFVMYFLFLRRRRKDREGAGEPDEPDFAGAV